MTKIIANIRGSRVVKSMGSGVALPGLKDGNPHLPVTMGKSQNFSMPLFPPL